MTVIAAPDQDTLDLVANRGFAVVPRAVAVAEVEAMRSDLELAIQQDIDTWDENPYYIDHWMVHNLMLRGGGFVSLLENRVIHGYLAELLSPHCILYAYTSSSMPPGGSNYSHRIHNDCQLLFPNYITNVGVVVALTNFTEENGSPYFLPGSQTSAGPPSESEFFASAERVFPRKGDAIIFNARCWHTGGSNRTGEARHAVTMNVCRHYMRQRFDYPRMMTAEILCLLGPLGRRFLGFDVRVPTSLEEYYRPPEERLFKPGQY